MDRRKFLQGAAALFCAPAIVKAESIMPIWVPQPGLIGSIDVFVGDFHTFKVIPGLTEREHYEIDHDLRVNGHVSPTETPLQGRAAHIARQIEKKRRELLRDLERMAGHPIPDSEIKIYG